ncbi:FadR/GntR family transcriptional regulator [Bacillus sp. B15-48]|uniref:FadR/GntR family transcriptional regulator n=1 Tax=Bacillus sp. B15-48 TaxID=1548601 RepID=UPI00193FDBF6|nr:FadR/GntR family transcriptional regulator [Bacillus sp. B15-48]MBM4764882.1 FCD domain-containing protein [Bacillus sp. B15-48]
MIQKLKKKSLVQQVYSQIKPMIKNGDWPLGSRIPTEVELMEMFGVSRNTLREAIRSLVQVGLLDTKQGDGTFVTSTSELNGILQKRMQNSTIIEIMEVRYALERQAAFLACTRRTEDDLKKIKHYSEKCRQFFNANDTENFVKADWKLHQQFVNASHNQLLMEIHAGLFEEIKLTISSTMGKENEYDPGHRALLEAIHDQDTERAVQAVDGYIQHFKNGLIAQDPDCNKL